MVDISRDVITRAAQGDLHAFEQIYSQTSGFVYGIAYRIMNNRSDAEEITQDVFMQVYRNLKNFKFESSFKTWAYRIATNAAINKYRQVSRERLRIKDYGKEALRQPALDPVSAHINKESAEETVASLLGTLGPDQRACILLREVEGLSYKDMARVLKININTVRSRLKRAREALVEKAGRREA